MKRNENFKFPCNTNKRQKLLQDTDDLWGDDPEVEEFDRCINLATQICSQTENQTQQINNSSITNYNDFNQKQQIVSSTQAFLPETMASTSKFNYNFQNNIDCSLSSEKSVNTIITNKEITLQDYELCKERILELELERKIKTQDLESKQGEILILRNQIKQAQKSMEADKMERMRTFQETQQAFETKQNQLNKEIVSFKCEIDLKNLEIANLREKLSEMKKICNSNFDISALNESLNNTNQLEFLRKKSKLTCDNGTNKQSKQVQTENNVIHAHKIILDFPLQRLIPQTLFENNKERTSIMTLRHFSNDGSSSYRHNFASNLKNETEETSKSALILKTTSEIEKNLTSITSMYPEIMRLLNCTQEELNSNKNIKEIIWKVLRITKKFLLNLLIKLYNLKMTLLSIENENTFSCLEKNYYKYENDCIFTGNLWSEDEKEIDVRRFIALISALSILNHETRKYLTGQLPNTLNNDYEEFESIANTLNIKLDNFKNSTFEFLTILSEIVSKIKQLRLSEQLCGFLASVLKLCSSLSYKNNILSSECYDLIFKLFKQIMFICSNQPVLKYACEFLKYMSQHYSFIVKICTGNHNISSNNGSAYFTEDSCLLQVLVSVIESCKLTKEMSCNILQCLENTISCNVYWMYHQDENRCKCLVQVYSLAISIMYKSSEEYSSQDENFTDKNEEQLYHNIFHVGLIFLDNLTIRIPDLVARCSRLYSQYQTIIKYINSIQHQLHLKKVHESALENLISQLNCDTQKEYEETNSKNNIDNIFNCNFTSF